VEQQLPQRSDRLRRLKTRAQFQAALAGATVARTPHFALHRCALEARPDVAPLFDTTDDVWLGAMVPKRWAKRAVTRNAIRRQIYNVGDAAETSLPHAAHVVRLRAGFDRKEFASATSEKLKAAVRAELQQLMQRARAARS
jgi:ribonuclease P protein component